MEKPIMDGNPLHFRKPAFLFTKSWAKDIVSKLSRTTYDTWISLKKTSTFTIGASEKVAKRLPSGNQFHGKEATHVLLLSVRTESAKLDWRSLQPAKAECLCGNLLFSISLDVWKPSSSSYRAAPRSDWSLRPHAMVRAGRGSRAKAWSCMTTWDTGA